MQPARPCAQKQGPSLRARRTRKCHPRSIAKAAGITAKPARPRTPCQMRSAATLYRPRPTTRPSPGQKLAVFALIASRTISATLGPTRDVSFLPRWPFPATRVSAKITRARALIFSGTRVTAKPPAAPYIGVGDHLVYHGAGKLWLPHMLYTRRGSPASLSPWLALGPVV